MGSHSSVSSVLMKRVNLDTEVDMHRGKIMGRDTGRMSCEHEGRDGDYAPTSQGIPKVASRPQEARREA